ncbi:hypothetical protein I4U23_005974 [Adineta vaga]|nr:hypothetical protein I4U23_005974 [Adineta vaga]
MCYKIQCQKCRKYTWAGCGMHKDSVMKNIPVNQRCTCHSNEQQKKQSSRYLYK